jgi:ZIP family zinc transporter
MNIFYLGFTVSLLAGLATGAGALPIYLGKQFSDDVMLGFSAGVMLAATAFSLLVPSISLGGPFYSGFRVYNWRGSNTFHRPNYPALSSATGPEGPTSNLSKIWLFIVAITIHNFPEGVAVGVSFGGGDIASGFIVATAIGLQNAPEDLAVALPLLREKYSKARALGYSTLTGLVEPLGGFLGLVLVSVAYSILPLGLAFAAGAMLFVIINEMVLESHIKGFRRKATFWLTADFAIIMPLGSMFK